MIVLEWMAMGCAVLLALPVSVFFLQIMFASTSRKNDSILTPKRPSVAVLIPAHNEAGGIAENLFILERHVLSRAS